MISDLFLKTLKKYGIHECVPLGEKFDPNLHEAGMEYEDPSKTPGTIGKIVEKGYTIGQRVLRAPKVGIVKVKGGKS